jgi:hypothetical protein
VLAVAEVRVDMAAIRLRVVERYGPVRQMDAAIAVPALHPNGIGLRMRSPRASVTALP